MPDRTRTSMIYLTIAQEMQTRIEDGRWPPGFELPSEIALAEEFAVSRATLRRALERLRGEGLILSSQGAPSFVRRQAPLRYLGPNRYHPAQERGAGSALMTVESEQTVLGVAQTTETKIVTAAELPVKHRSWLKLHDEADDEVPLLRRRATFRADGTVQQVWESWLPMAVVEGTVLADPATDPWAGTTVALLESLGWRYYDVLEHVSVRRPEEDEARRLGMPMAVPIMVVERVMLFLGPDGLRGQAKPLEVATVLLPGDRTVLVNRFPGE